MLRKIAAVTHLSLNFRGLVHHLKTRSVAVYGSALVAALVLLYGVAMQKEIPAELAQQMDAAAAQLEEHD